MPFKTYVGKDFGSHVLGKTAVSYVKVYGTVVWSNYVPQQKTTSAEEAFGLSTSIAGAFLNDLYVPEYEQKWSTEQPSQHNTPVPVDEVGASVDIINTTTPTEKFKYVTHTTEQVGASVDIVNVTVTVLTT